jgi:hypothetical protein
MNRYSLSLSDSTWSDTGDVRESKITDTHVSNRKRGMVAIFVLLC